LSRISLQATVGSTELILLQGDITLQDTDAIVNAANSSLLGGGGVDGAIHRAGGPEILKECRAIRARQGECLTGEAVITGGGKLKARHVIHAVGPVWRGGNHDEEQMLSSAYINTLRLAPKCIISGLAVENGAHTIAFPSISTGIYGFPIERASRIAFNTVSDFVRKHPQIKEVRFIAFSQHDYDVYAPLFPQPPDQ